MRSSYYAHPFMRLVVGSSLLVVRCRKICTMASLLVVVVGAWMPHLPLRRVSPIPAKEAQRQIGWRGMEGINQGGGSDSSVTDESSSPFIQDTIYSMPELYDIAFGYRDYEEEVDCLLRIHHSLTGRSALSILELAAGPARHSLTALSQGTDRLAIAIDSSPSMASYALDLANEILTNSPDDDNEVSNLDTGRKRFDYRVDDMRSFRLEPNDGPVDTVWMLLGSLQHLTTNEQVIECFQAVHRALRDDGTFILELPHPREIFSMGECTRNGWEVPLDDEDGNPVGELKIIWGDDNDRFDAIQQIRYLTVAFQLSGSELPSDQVKDLTEFVPVRVFTTQEIDALARCANLKLVRMLGALQQDEISIEDEDLAYRSIFVLQKNL